MKLRVRVRHGKRFVLEPNGHMRIAVEPSVLRRVMSNSFWQATLAACLVITVGFEAYRLGARSEGAASLAVVSRDDRFQKLAAEKKSADEMLAAQATRIGQL